MLMLTKIYLSNIHPCAPRVVERGAGGFRWKPSVAWTSE